MTPNKLQRLRRQAFMAQNYRCFYCLFPMWERNPGQFALDHGLKPRLAKHLKCTAEHLMARQDGGGNTLENIVAACLWCNGRRHSARVHNAPDPATYKAKVTALIAKGRWHPVTAANSTRSVAHSRPTIVCALKQASRKISGNI